MSGIITYVPNLISGQTTAIDEYTAVRISKTISINPHEPR